MKNVFKSISSIIVAIGIVVGGTHVVRAAGINGGSSNVCYSDCNQYMGVATLMCNFDYEDGSYVEAGGMDLYFMPNSDYNYSCQFMDMDTTSGRLTDSASAWSTYLATDYICRECGFLRASCDIYGQTSDDSYVIYRQCDH